MYIEHGVSISFKKIAIILILSTITLFTGSVLKNVIFIIPVVALIYYILTKDIDTYILFLVFWMYISNYYYGQMWITNNIASKLIDVRYPIILIIILNWNKFYLKNHFEYKLRSWTIFFILIMVFRELVLFQNTGFGVLIFPYYVYLYFIIIYLPRSSRFTNNMLNMIVTIGILQLLVSFLQVSGIIAPSLNAITDSGTVIVSGFDDVAVGTMGITASNKASWIGTILFLFFFSIGIVKKKTSISILSLLFLLQYATVDSKTLLGVTIIAIVLLLIRLNIVKIFFSKNVLILLVIMLFGFSMYSMIDKYYSSYSSKGIEETYGYVYSSIDEIFLNLSEWGKFKGFTTIYKEYANEDIFHLFVGTTRPITAEHSTVRLADISIMKKSNITNSMSSLISSFANGGLLRMILIIWFYWIFFASLRQKKIYTLLGYSFAKSGPIMLLSSIIGMFLITGLKFGDLPFALIMILYALVNREENIFNKQHDRFYQ